MRRALLLLVAVALSCCSAPAFADDDLIWIKKKVAAAGGGGGASYLVSESFDTNPGYDNAGVVWTIISGGAGINPDYATSPAPLEGTQSLLMDGCAPAADQQVRAESFAAVDTSIQEFYFLARFPTLHTQAGGASSDIAYVLQGGTNVAAVAVVCTSGTCLPRVTASGGTAATAVGAVDNSSLWHFWVKYAKGTGADAYASVAFSTTGVRPTSGNSFAASTNGTATAAATRFAVKGDYAGSATACVKVIIDKFRVDDATIGDNPQ